MIHSGNRYLSQSEMIDNATYIYNYLITAGWTPQAICGMLGNMQSESTINPAIWQSLDEGNLSLGFGLVQWTPATKYLNWASDNNLTPELMDSNLQRILYEVDNSLQWINSSMSFYEFTQSTDTPYNLGIMFLTYYERPANPNQPQRGTQAENWFSLLNGGGVIIGEIIEDYCNYMGDIANDDYHTYSQVVRSLYNYNNPTSFDCSSLILTALLYAYDNHNKTPTPKDVGCSYTGNMLKLQNCDFEIVDDELQRGDIVLTVTKGHTAVYLGNNQLVHARNPTDGISITNYYDHPWEYILRLKGINITPPVEPPDNHPKPSKGKSYLYIRKGRNIIL